MHPLLKNEDILNVSIGVYSLLAILARSWIQQRMPMAHWVFVFGPIFLLLWAGFLIYEHLRRPTLSSLLPHKRLESGDYWRVAIILWAGHTPLASAHVLGFYLFTAVAIPLICILITITVVDLYQNRQLTPLALGCAVFVFGLLSWERRTFVVHYGVPIIGHFFEKPEYDAKYYVQVKREGSAPKYKLLAYIQVEGRMEEIDEREDYYGTPIISAYEVRDVWIRRIHFPNGGFITIEDQDEPLHLGDSVFVTDNRGENWYVTLLNEYVR